MASSKPFKTGLDNSSEDKKINADLETYAPY